MPDPAELLAVARLLSAAGPPSDARFRRAVSTAYYALFHKVLRAAAARLTSGAENTAGYALLYRGFDHRRMKEVCDALQASTLKERYKSALRRQTASQDERDFAALFSELQEGRHSADYDPLTQFDQSAAVLSTDAAETAIDSFDRIPPDEQADILALMLVGARLIRVPSGCCRRLPRIVCAVFSRTPPCT